MELVNASLLKRHPLPLYLEIQRIPTNVRDDTDIYRSLQR
jgi:hypothetical protein